MANSSIIIKRREAYIGEKKQFLRDGYGTYVYENQYFRYEGEWMKGKKHGHGRLIMKDGTFYDGQFVDGEINGHGYKYFAFSQSKYTGQFLNGEQHGDGNMVYRNGNIYDGQWYRNKRQGFGILITIKKYCDEESYQSCVLENNRTHPYDNTYHNISNGDKYEGFWIMDKRQGHGELACEDGTTYKGQFMNNLFHGEGTMAHASGIYSTGMWINGFPADMATKIVLIVEETPLILYQGQSFSIKVECSNDEDQIIQETGRELQLIAGFKYWKSKDGLALFDVIEDVEEKPIPTPFYDVVPYPLTDQLLETKAYSDVGEQWSGVGSDQEEDDDKEDEEAMKKFIENSYFKPSYKDDIESTAQSKDSRYSQQEVASFLAEEADLSGDQDANLLDSGKDAKPEDMSHIFPPVRSKPTANGICEWLNLQLAPPPPMYRPFAIMEEEAIPKIKSKQSVTRDQSNIGNEVVENEDGIEETEASASNVSLSEADQNKGKEDEEVVSVIDEAMDDKNNFYEERKSLLTPAESLLKHASKTGTIKKGEEKFARPGEYILIVQDITNPPFMGRRLQTAYLVVHLKEPEKPVKKAISEEIDEDDTENM